jgi:hypothetical protein
MKPKTFIGTGLHCRLWATGIDWGNKSEKEELLKEDKSKKKSNKSMLLLPTIIFCIRRSSYTLKILLKYTGTSTLQKNIK